RYLASGMFEGIGEKTAALLVDHFGEKTLDVLEHHPEKLQTIPNFGKRKIGKLMASWRAHTESRQTYLFLAGLGITLLTAHKIVKLFGEQTIAMVTANPYCLIRRVHGIGFLNAD